MDDVKQFNLDFLKQQRKRLGFSMRDMARILGFKHASTYFRYEKGYSSFKVDHLTTLAKHLGCDVSDFFTKNVADSATKECG